MRARSDRDPADVRRADRAVLAGRRRIASCARPPEGGLRRGPRGDLVDGNPTPPPTFAADPPGLARFMTAIGRVESGGRYTARNARTGAYGKYQIIPSSWRGWARLYLHNANARKTPANQEKVAAAKFRAAYRWLGGSWRRVAYNWLTGSSRKYGWSRFATSYVNKVMRYYAQAHDPRAPVRKPATPTPRPSPTPTPIAPTPSPSVDPAAAPLSVGATTSSSPTDAATATPTDVATPTPTDDATSSPPTTPPAARATQPPRLRATRRPRALPTTLPRARATRRLRRPRTRRRQVRPTRHRPTRPLRRRRSIRHRLRRRRRRRLPNHRPR